MRRYTTILKGAILCMLLQSCGDVKDGETGPEGKQGEVGTTGPQGSVGRKGTTGQKGDTGDKGDTGLDGTDGEDGTEILMIDPCPDMAIAHPEVLACIGHAIYGVLTDVNWKRIRFVELEEGIWYQTTDGRNCIFKVESSCQIEIRKE